MPNQSKHIGSFVPQNSGGESPKGKNYLYAIAIDEYEHCPKLYNAVKDANDLVQVLSEQYYFEEANIITLFNEQATESNIIHNFRDIARSLTPQDNLVIFFSGHGEFDEVFKEGYWVPVGAKRGALEDYVPNSKIRTILNAISSHHTFLISDSCFSGTLFAGQSKDVAAQRLERDPSRWGLTAGRNEIVDDGKPGSNSPFADSLIYHLKTNDKPLGVMELCQKVIEEVVANAQQTPRGEPLKVDGHRGGQFYFHPKALAQAQGLVSEPLPAKRRGNLLHNIPEEMELGRDTRCEVRIAFDKETLLQDIPEDMKVEIRGIRVSNLMEVDLLDPSNEATQAFEVRPISQKEQFIEEGEYTQWVYYVKALKPGSFPLLLKVTIIEFIHGKERKRDIVLEEFVQIVTEVPELVKAGNTYKTTDQQFDISPDEPGRMDYPESEALPPPSPAASPASSIIQPSGAAPFQDLTKMTKKQSPVAAPKKFSRARITQIAGILVILLAALVVLPDQFSGGGSDKTSAEPHSGESEGDDYPSPNRPDRLTIHEQIIGTWQLIDFQQDGVSVYDTTQPYVSYIFEEEYFIVRSASGDANFPYNIRGMSLHWSTNSGRITFDGNRMTIDGKQLEGDKRFLIVLQKIE